MNVNFIFHIQTLGFRHNGVRAGNHKIGFPVRQLFKRLFHTVHFDNFGIRRQLSLNQRQHAFFAANNAYHPFQIGYFGFFDFFIGARNHRQRIAEIRGIDIIQPRSVAASIKSRKDQIDFSFQNRAAHFFFGIKEQAFDIFDFNLFQRFFDIFGDKAVVSVNMMAGFLKPIQVGGFPRKRRIMGKPRDFKGIARVLSAAEMVGKFFGIASDGSGIRLRRRKNRHQSEKQQFFHFFRILIIKNFSFLIF